MLSISHLKFCPSLKDRQKQRPKKIAETQSNCGNQDSENIFTSKIRSFADKFLVIFSLNYFFPHKISDLYYIYLMIERFYPPTVSITNVLWHVRNICYRNCRRVKPLLREILFVLLFSGSFLILLSYVLKKWEFTSKSVLYYSNDMW